MKKEEKKMKKQKKEKSGVEDYIKSSTMNQGKKDKLCQQSQIVLNI